MSDKPPDHETLERVLKTEPLKALDTLPDCTESREAKRLVSVVDDLAHQAREKVKPS
jgi:hypothetical protein